MKSIILKIFLMSFFGVPVLAHDCRQFFNSGHRHHVQHVQAVQAVQQFYYFVGAPVRVEALVEKALRKDPRWEEFQAYKQNQAGPQKETGPQPEVRSYLKLNCGRCHSGPEPKAGLILDGSAPIESATVTKVLSWVAGIEKPAGDTMRGVVQRIKDEDKPKLMDELLRSTKK